MKSILDTDLYLFSVSYLNMKLYPDAEGVFEFVDRNRIPRTEEFLERLKQEFKELEYLHLTADELRWSIEHNSAYIPQFYWEWLSSFRFDYSKINAWLDGDKVLHVRAGEGDKIYKSGLYEIPILASVSKVSHELNHDIYNMKEQVGRINEKIKMSNEYELKFADMSTRRRFSFEIEDMVVRECAKNAKYFVGTSNVYLAMKYNVKPIGTMNHAFISFTAMHTGYKSANYYMMEDWIKTFDGYLGTALTDCYTNDVFFANFSRKHAALFEGIRHDSGDEIEFVDKAVKRYKELGIDPREKSIVFSNALTFPKYKEIAAYCKGKIKCSAGIGTNLACDIPGVKAENIVMKLWEARMNSKQEWSKIVKISDTPEKATGDKEEIETCLRTLGIEINK